MSRPGRVAPTLTVDDSRQPGKVGLVETPEELDRVDLVVLATKAYDVDRVGPWLHATAGAVVVIAQNGLGHADRVARWVPEQLVAPAIVTYGAARGTGGGVIQTLEGVVRVPDTPPGHAFAEVARGSALAVEIVAQHGRALWTKLCWNVLGNSLSTLADVPVREIAERSELRAVAVELGWECADVASASGCALPEGLTLEILHAFAAYPDTVRSSMWQDRAAGRPYEHDAISGSVLRAAARHHVDVPVTRTVHRLLATMSPPRR